MFKMKVAALSVVACAALGVPVLGEDDFPITGTYTENRACAGADASILRVKITTRDIDLPTSASARSWKKREGAKISVHVECKGPGGAVMLGDVNFTIKADNTLDFADQDNTYKAVLHKCPD